MCRQRSLTLLVIALGVLITPSGRVLAQNTAVRSATDLPEPVIQSNHAGAIKALVVSPSGELVASGSVDGTVKLWSQNTGLMLQTISVSPTWVRSLAFSADSRRLAVGMGDHFVYLYDIPSGTLLRTLRGADSAVVAIAFSRDGALLAASTTRDNKVYVWRTDEGRVIATIPRPARALRFMSETGWLLITDGTSTSEWRIELSGQAVAVSGASETAKASAAFAPLLQSTGSPPTAVDGWGRTIAKARGAVVEWSTGAIAEPSQYPSISAASLRAVRFSPDDRVMVTTSNRGDVAVWDLESGALSQYVQDAAGATSAFAAAVAFSGDGASITAVRGESRAHWTWQLSSLTPLTLPPRTDKADGFTADNFSESRADIGKPAPPMPPQLGIVGNPEKFVTTRAILARSGDTAIYGGFTTPTFVRYVTAENLRTGAAQWTYNVPAAQRGRNINAMAATPDGDLVTVAFDDGTVMWLDGASGSLRHADQSPTERPIAVLEFSPGGDLLAGANQSGEIALWRRDGTGLPSPPRRAENVLALAFSQDNRLLASGAVDNTIELWDIASARVIRTLVGHTSAVTALGFAHRSDILISGSEDSTLRVWNARSGGLLAAAYAAANGDWLTVSPEGFFDGTRGGWNAAPSRFKSAPTTLYRPEQFFKQFYEPGLLAEVVARQQPVLALLRERRDSRASLDISKLRSSKLPTVAVKIANARASSTRSAQVAVSVKDGGSGMRDLRIFRNQSLVRFVHGPLGPGNRSFSTTVEVELTEGPNEISAYAFNNDDIKSEDASDRVEGGSALKRARTAYVVAVGVNEYSNPAFNLSYAAPDARLLAERLSANFAETRDYASVETIVLTNQEATRNNVLFVLQRLAGLQPVPLQSTPKRLLQLPRAHPEDAVVLFYAGHGEAFGGQYYLLPYDLPYSGPKTALTQSDLTTILSQAISDRDLNEVLEQIDAGKMMLVIDACYSGQVLESSESRRGPLNARGIAQLAYEKGAYVLAASQSDAEALELARLSHGVLTYVLIERGLDRLQADANQDGSVTVREWFRHAQITVPLELTSLKNERARSGRPITVGGNELGPQRPQFYFRRETPDSWIVGRRTR